MSFQEDVTQLRDIQKIRDACHSAMGERVHTLQRGMVGHLLAFPEQYSHTQRAFSKSASDIPLCPEEDRAIDDLIFGTTSAQR